MTEAVTNRPRPGALPAAGGLAPLWRSSTAGALVAIALLVAATVAAAIALSVIDQQRRAREQLTRLAHNAALLVGGRLVETEQMLLLEGSAYATAPERFRPDMEELLRANPALLRIELRGRDGRTLHRSNVFGKMGVRSAVELARLLENVKD